MVNCKEAKEGRGEGIGSAIASRWHRSKTLVFLQGTEMLELAEKYRELFNISCFKASLVKDSMIML